MIPCPHNCENWVRICNPREPQPNHHPRCVLVDESLIDVWRVQTPGDPGGCIVATEAQAREIAYGDPDAPLEITPMKMHREIFEQLPDFFGF